MLSTEPKLQSAQLWQPKHLLFSVCVPACDRIYGSLYCIGVQTQRQGSLLPWQPCLQLWQLTVWVYASVCVCVCVYKLYVCRAVTPMGVSSLSTVKAVNKLGRSDRELGGDWPRWPFGSERRDRLMSRRERERQNKRLGDTSFRGRTNNKADTLPKHHPRPPEALFTLACVPFVPCPCPGTREEEIRQQRGRERDKG